MKRFNLETSHCTKSKGVVETKFSYRCDPYSYDIIRYFNSYSHVDQLSGDPLDRFSRRSARTKPKKKEGKEMRRIICPIDNEGEHGF